MLYDLNIAWSPQSNPAELDRTLRFSASLGYDVIALNHTIGGQLPANNITNPIPKFDSLAYSSSTTPKPKLPTVLRRATVVLTEPAQHHRLPQLASAYDILAVRPQTDDAFSAACQNLTDISIISLDMTVRQPFTFRPKPCMFAVSRGIRFEVCYSQVLQGPAPVQVLGPKGARDGGSNYAAGADARARAAFIGNVSSLIRATRGRGIIISSEARSVLGLRGPADVTNLLHVWGLPADRAKEGLSVLPRGVVVNEGLKRSGFRGVIDIINVADPIQADVEMGEGDNEKPEAATKNLPGKKGKNQESNKKRKNGDGAETPGTGGSGEGQPMSKRQEKRLKAAMRQKQAEAGIGEN
ncbi:RNase P subunit p30-domain-containing protein [Xylaria arbuscula]|nr:RNase P subunit p30-domain-containing protein [Xylaria arbuscula]